MRILLIMFLSCALIGMLGAASPLEDVLRIGREYARRHPAPQNVVIVGIDDRSLAEFGRWPWSRQLHARLVDDLRRLNARRIFFDVGFFAPSTPAEDATLERALKQPGSRVTLAARYLVNAANGERTDLLPLPRFAPHADVASIDWDYASGGQVQRLPLGVHIGGRLIPSLSAAISDTPATEGSYPIDLAIDPQSVPEISAAAIIDRSVPASAIAGKDVVIGATSQQLNDNWLQRGYGLVPGVLIHVLGAQTLQAGRPIEISWMVPFALATLVMLLSFTRLRRRYVIAAMTATIGALLLAPLALDMHRIWTTVAPALLLALCALGCEAWRSYREYYRGQAKINAISGLPNLTALMESKDGDQTALVVARIRNFAEIHATLPPGEARALAEQITQRFSLGNAASRIYQGDEGIFAWFHEGTLDELPDHLEALHAICRAPAIVEDRRIDLRVVFGVDINTDRALPNRLASALLAADEADQAGDRWTVYEGAPGEEAAWRLSLLGQLDEAIAEGQIWVAYQPQLAIASGRLESAEALVRWTHPEKGNIAPNDFISAAERGGRIGNLTYFVLERALADVRLMNEQGHPFSISVNLSPLLLAESDLVLRVQSLLRRYGIPPHRLTLEITETEKIVDNRRAIAVLTDLRAAGIAISIDDYGTGRSTLEYLRTIPADELKIDQSFVRNMARNPGDRLMVESTIELAHSLGHRVVAEGVEDEEALRILVAARCDLIQGYHIARPMPFSTLACQLLKREPTKAA
ncbi:putative bifunctional diguanylate cyclase/phosphodiesterase [Flavisphingomonas formosensis]|uniref:putative bifunctional diguanylate cyclase/phosphodiesterase n=1 Tax=Flavisphingomonas formosensis TaxID=861534 RepID=UPI0018DF15D9|nr:EAL domain-containing protein [Sphingomonas formosensis]